jgi:hypothetical protein
VSTVLVQQRHRYRAHIAVYGVAPNPADELCAAWLETGATPTTVIATHERIAAELARMERDARVAEREAAVAWLRHRDPSQPAYTAADEIDALEHIAARSARKGAV